MHIPYIQVLLIQVTWVFLFLFFFTLLCLKWVPDDPEIIFLATSFTQKNTERSDFKYSSILMLENIWYHYFTWSVSNSQEIVNSFQFSLSPRGLINEKRLTISCEFGPLLSSIRKVEYMEFELFGIFWVKVGTKNLVLGTQCQVVLEVWCLFLKKHTNFLSQTITFEWFHC